MLYASSKTKKYNPLMPIELAFKKLPTCRECEVSIKDTGIKAVFTVCRYDKINNKVIFSYECMPVLSFNVDDIGLDNMKKIKVFMNTISSTVEYRVKSTSDL